MGDKQHYFSVDDILGAIDILKTRVKLIENHLNPGTEISKALKDFKVGEESARLTSWIVSEEINLDTALWTRRNPATPTKLAQLMAHSCSLASYLSEFTLSPGMSIFDSLLNGYVTRTLMNQAAGMLGAMLNSEPQMWADGVAIEKFFRLLEHEYPHFLGYDSSYGSSRMMHDLMLDRKLKSEEQSKNQRKRVYNEMMFGHDGGSQKLDIDMSLPLKDLRPVRTARLPRVVL
jgi:hypothetical protein